MDPDSIAAVVLLGGSVLGFLIGFPLAVRDNPRSRRQRSRRHDES